MNINYIIMKLRLKIKLKLDRSLDIYDERGDEIFPLKRKKMMRKRERTKT